MSTPSTPPPVKSSEEYFNSSRLKVIGLITAATVAVGALGGIAGVAFDPDPVPKDNVIQPGGDGGLQLSPQSLGGPGNSAPRGGGASSPFTSRVPGSDATSSPSSVGSVSPGSGGLTGGPTEDATDEPTPSNGGTACAEGSGCGALIEATQVAIYVPPNWNVDFTDDNRVFQSDGNGSFSFAFSYADQPSAAAGDVITQNLESLLPPENYTQLQTSDVVPLEPFGSVVSIAGDRVRSALGRQPGVGEHPRPDLRGCPPGRHRARHPDRARSRGGLRVGVPGHDSDPRQLLQRLRRPRLRLTGTGSVVPAVGAAGTTRHHQAPPGHHLGTQRATDGGLR